MKTTSSRRSSAITRRAFTIWCFWALDPAMKTLSLALHYAEQLARQHGALQDRSPEAKQLVNRWNAERKFLF